MIIITFLITTLLIVSVDVNASPRKRSEKISCSSHIPTELSAEEKLSLIYELFRYLESKKVSVKLFRNSQFRTNNAELVRHLKAFKKLGDKPSLISSFLDKNKEAKKKTWQEHIKLSGVDLDKLKKESEEKEKQEKLDLIYEFFRFLEQSKVDISLFETVNYKSNDPQLIAFLKTFEKLGDKPSVIYTFLIRKAKELTWEEHIIKSGVNLEKVRVESLALKNEKNLADIYGFFRYLKAQSAHVDMYSTMNYQHNHKKIKAYMKKYKKLGDIPSFIYTFLNTHYKDESWEKHLENAGINLKEERRLAERKRIDEKIQLIYQFFRFLKNEGADISMYSSVSFQRNNSRLKRYLRVFKKLGSSPSSLYSFLNIEASFLTWKEHLENAGIYLDDLRTDSYRQYIQYKISFAKKFFQDLHKYSFNLKELSSTRFRLSPLMNEYLDNFSSQNKQMTYQEFALGEKHKNGYRIFKNTKNLYNFIKVHYKGGIDKFLSDSGFNPDEVRLRGSVDYSVLAHEFQVVRAEEQERINVLSRGGVAFDRVNDARYNNKFNDIGMIVVDDADPESVYISNYEGEESGVESESDSYKEEQGNVADSQDDLTRNFNEQLNDSVLELALQFLVAPNKTFDELLTDDFLNYYMENSDSELLSEFKRLGHNLREYINTVVKKNSNLLDFSGYNF